MIVLNGKTVAETKNQATKKRAEEYLKKYGRQPGLAVVIVGDDPASHVYVKNKVAACEKSGIRSFHHHLSADANEEDVIRLIERLNDDRTVDAMLVQLPLPKSLNANRILNHINPRKDADGLTIENLGLLLAGRPRVSPCTPRGVIEILKHYDIPISGKNCVVVGRSQIVGRPMAQLLLLEDASVDMVHSKTTRLREHTKRADIVIVAAGRPRFLGADDFSEGSVVIDVGIHRLFEGLCGDVRFEEMQSKVKAATPVPGGVGPMTIAMLLQNTIDLAEAADKSRNSI